MNPQKPSGRLRMKDAGDRNAVLAEYTKWLLEYRNACEVTIRKHLRYLVLFLEWMAQGRHVDALSGLSHDQVESFFLHYSSTRGAASREQMQAVLRVFLRFCCSKGYTRDLSGAIPTLRSFTLTTVPRATSEEDIRRVLAQVNGSTPAGLRDRAIIHMFREYGVRSKQVRTLREWHVGNL